MKQTLLFLLSSVALEAFSLNDLTLQRFQAVEAVIEDASERYGVPANLLKAQLFVESGFDPRAVSPTGVRGIAQITKDTAKRFNINRLNVESSVYGMARIMLYNYANLPSYYIPTERWKLSLLIYNRGKGGSGGYWSTKRYLKQHNKPLTYVNMVKRMRKFSYMREGLTYVTRIMALLEVSEEW